MDVVFGTLNLIISVLILAIFASAVLSWLPMLGIRVSRYNPVVRIIEDISDLMLRPIRRAMPTTAGSLDFSPMVALILLMIVRAVLTQVARTLP